MMNEIICTFKGKTLVYSKNCSIFVPSNIKLQMDYDISQSVSQGSFGAQDAENRRIEAIADELRRRCELYEAQRGDCQPHVSLFETEQRVAEAFAKEKGLWLPMDKVFELGTPGPSGNENDTYVSDDIIYKVNNLLNCGSILRLFEKIRIHNELFPDTYYQFHAFTGFDGRTIMPILKQDLVKDAEPTPQIAIDTYMAALGFYREEAIGRYSNDVYTVWDLIPRNVLRDRDGDIFVVDAEIKRK